MSHATGTATGGRAEIQTQINWLLSPNVQRRRWHPTPVLLPGNSHGRRSLVGCSPWGREESDTTERLHFHFSLSCIGEGNGNPLHCSCLENPRDGGAWWAAVCGVAQSWTWLKRLSSSSSSKSKCYGDAYPKQQEPKQEHLPTGLWWCFLFFSFFHPSQSQMQKMSFTKSNSIHDENLANQKLRRPSST